MSVRNFNLVERKLAKYPTINLKTEALLIFVFKNCFLTF